MANHYGTRWRGKLDTEQHCHPLVKILFEEMNRQQCTMAEVARRTGIAKATIGDWRRRRSPSLVNIEACFNALGYELRLVRRVDKAA